MMHVMDDRVPHDASSSSEFAELDSEIRRMSLHADSLLESIREVSGEIDFRQLNLSPCTKLTSTERDFMDIRTPELTEKELQKSQDYLNYEDDDMTQEEERLESIADSIRESLTVQKLQNISDYTPCTEHYSNQSDAVEQSNEILLLGCSIVWAMVMIIFIHAKYFLLNERGQVQYSFGLQSFEV